MTDEGVKGDGDPQERFEVRLPRQEGEVAHLSREVRTGDADPADLADALSRLGATLAFFKRTVDQLPLKVQEVAIRRQLAADHSVRRRGQLAFALLGLATLQRQLGLVAEEEATIGECVAIYREATSTDWLRYAPLFATALDHLAEVRLAQHDADAAVRLGQESLEVWRQAHPNHTLYADDVARANAFVERAREY